MATITIRASDSAAALEEVLRQLGPDALILSTRQNRGQVEIVAASALPPDSTAVASSPPGEAATCGFAGHLRRQFSRDAIGEAADLPARLPGRIVLAGPPGAGRSMLAARLAAEMLRNPGARRPKLVAPRPDILTPPGPLSGSARLIGLVPHRPIWGHGCDGRLPPPDAHETQIVDLSAMPQMAPRELAALAALPEARLWLVLPAGLHASYQDQICRPLAEIADLVVLTRTDLCPPTSDDLGLAARHGLQIALLSHGTGLVDALSAPGLPPAAETSAPISECAMKDPRDAASRIS